MLLHHHGKIIKSVRKIDLATKASKYDKEGDPNWHNLSDYACSSICFYRKTIESYFPKRKVFILWSTGPGFYYYQEKLHYFCATVITQNRLLFHFWTNIIILETLIWKIHARSLGINFVSARKPKPQRKQNFEHNLESFKSI